MDLLLELVRWYLLAALLSALVLVVVVCTAQVGSWLRRPFTAPLQVMFDSDVVKVSFRLRSPVGAWRARRDPSILSLVGLEGAAAYALSGSPVGASLLFEQLLPVFSTSWPTLREQAASETHLRQVVLAACTRMAVARGEMEAVPTEPAHRRRLLSRWWS